MENSKIEWTDATANFWWGCLKVSPGCEHCYAETLSNRFSGGIWGPAKTTSREYKKGIWEELPRWNKKARESGERMKVFVMSMGDFFEDHQQAEEWRWDALALMQECKSIDFQVLTKRPENVIEMIETSRSHSFSDAGMWFYANPHVWIGTSVENQATADERIPELLQIPAAVLFLSMEPLLGPVDISRYCGVYENEIGTSFGRPQYRIESGIDWVIVGGESGPNARPMHPDWARSILDQCQAAGVPFFFKQWGEWLPNCQTNGIRKPKIRQGEYERIGKHAAGRLLDGREWNETPQAVKA